MNAQIDCEVQKGTKLDSPSAGYFLAVEIRQYQSKEYTHRQH